MLVVVGCSGAAGPVGTATPAAPTDTPGNAPLPGGWQGTITLHAVIDVNTTKDGHNGDPGSVYYETYTTTELTQTDVTDTYTISAHDPDDLTYGIHEVDLAGSAANAGTTDERYVTTTQKSNSGCTWTDEVGTETSGSWNGSGKAEGTLQFNEDGSYSIDIRPGLSGPNGESADSPQLPYRNWEAISNLSAGCNGTGYDNTTTQGPIVWWVSSLLGDPDINYIYSRIDGQMNTASPGSTADGTVTWEMASPQGLTMTITWHLVHDGPIVLPHS
jgi:hypothetical protein